MEHTALTAGGFTQPYVPKAIIDNSSSTGKGYKHSGVFGSSQIAKFYILEIINE